MKHAFVIVAIVASLDVIAILFYFPLAYLNLTFTFDDLPVGDIPFYNPSTSIAQTNRYNYGWWEMATDSFRFLQPILMYMAICTEMLWGPHSPMGYIIPLAIIAVLETLKTVVRSYWWAVCSTWQFCRNFDTSMPAGSANYVWISIVIFQIFFFIISLLYLWLITVIAKSTGKKQKLEQAKQSVFAVPVESLYPTTISDMSGQQYIAVAPAMQQQQQRYSQPKKYVRLGGMQ